MGIDEISLDKSLICPNKLMETVACPICGCKYNVPFAFENAKIEDKTLSLGINICQICRHCYISPRLTSDTLNYHYNRCFYDETTKSSFTECFTNDIYIDTYIDCRNYAFELLPGGGNLLDIGCGTGNFLAQFDGVPRFHTIGIDISKEAIKEARNRGLNVFTGDAENHHFKAQSFDIISLIHVLEHVQNPVKVLTHCANLLRPGGFIIIVVPNYYYLRTVNFIRPHIKKSKDYGALEHLHNFIPRTLNMAISKAGLIPRKWGTGKFTKRGSNKNIIFLKNFLFVGVLLLCRLGIILGDIHLIAQKPFKTFGIDYL